MKNIFRIGFVAAISALLYSCADENVEAKKELPAIAFCDCITPSPENTENCKLLYPDPVTAEDSLKRNADLALCNGEEVNMMDSTLSQVAIDSAMKNYENDLSLEIKEIPEEILDPISDECKTFLEEYAAEIKLFSSLIKNIEKSPNDINLMIARGPAEDDLSSFASKPEMFKCSQNDAFKKQVEILNNKKDKLISN